MARKINLTQVPHGTYTRIAKEYGCSPALVNLVAQGKRKNAKIELMLLKAYKKEQNLKAKISRYHQNLHQ